MKDNRDAIDFSKEPVGKLFRKMFFPTLVGMVSMVVLNITDGAFVGHGAGSDSLAAVNIVAPFFTLMSGLGLMFGIGSSVVASIHLAKGNRHAANLNLTQGVLASILLGVLLGGLVFSFQPQVCKLFGCNDKLVLLACSYLQWVSLMAPFNLFGMTGMFMVRLDGHPKFAMAVNCFMAILNIILDYLFIFPLHMGLEGAAIATSISFTLGNIPLAWFLLTKTRNVHFFPIRMTRTSLSLTVRNLAYQIKIGASGLLGEFAVAAVMILGNYVFIHYLGEDGVAAYSVGCYCLPIVFMLGNSIVNSVQPIVSFAHGVQDHVRLYQSKRIAIWASIGSGLAGLLFMSVGAPFISVTFLDPACRAYQLCLEGLPLYSPAFLFIAINIVLIGYLQSTEAAREATFFTLLRGFIFSVPCFILLPMAVGNDGLWLALPLAEGLTTLLLTVRFLFPMKKLGSFR